MYDEWGAGPAHIKAETSGFDPLQNFPLQAQNVNKPLRFLTLSGPLTYHFQQQQHPHMQMAPHMHGYGEYANDSSLNDEANAMNAANGLYQLTQMGNMVGQHRSSTHAHSSTLHMNGGQGASGGTWGAIDGGSGGMGGMHEQRGVNENLQSPMNSSGRQSSNSHHSHQHFANPLQPAFGHGHGQEWMNQMITNTVQQQHSRSYDLFPQELTRVSQSAQPRYYGGQMSTAAHFGTDPAFGDMHYQAPSAHMSREDEKSGNLVNVPYAGQAARGHSHAHPFTSPSMGHGQYRYSAPNIPTFTSTSSQATMGGLPNYTTNATRRSLTAAEMRRQSNGSIDGGEEVDEYAVPESLKRRKSSIDAKPAGHMKTPVPKKRSSKSAKAGPDPDDEYMDLASSSTRPTSKRRKLSTNERTTSPGSQEYSTPRDDESESPGAETKTSSGKKKSKTAHQARINLTDEEKRMNHIRSEKSRRDLIKQHYDTLDSIVPGLRSGRSGLSRADVILEIVNYVVHLQTGNQQMESILANYQGPANNDDDDEDGYPGGPGAGPSDDHG